MQTRWLILCFLMIPVFLTACRSSGQERPGPGAEPIAAIEASPVPRGETQDTGDTSTLPPADCPVTVPQEPPFTPPPPYDELGFEGDFWFGSSSLWTAVPKSGVWPSLPEGPEGYSQKIFWWRDGYVVSEEPQPALEVTGERLDAEAPPLRALRATNASAGDIGSAMLTGVEFPTRGCWRITGKYGEAELSFVVWIAP